MVTLWGGEFGCGRSWAESARHLAAHDLELTHLAISLQIDGTDELIASRHDSAGMKGFESRAIIGRFERGFDGRVIGDPVKVSMQISVLVMAHSIASDVLMHASADIDRVDLNQTMMVERCSDIGEWLRETGRKESKPSRRPDVDSERRSRWHRPPVSGEFLPGAEVFKAVGSTEIFGKLIGSNIESP